MEFNLSMHGAQAVMCYDRRADAEMPLCLVAVSRKPDGKILGQFEWRMTDDQAAALASSIEQARARHAAIRAKGHPLSTDMDSVENFAESLEKEKALRSSDDGSALG